MFFFFLTDSTTCCCIKIYILRDYSFACREEDECLKRKVGECDVAISTFLPSEVIAPESVLFVT